MDGRTEAAPGMRRDRIRLAGLAGAAITVLVALLIAAPAAAPADDARGPSAQAAAKGKVKYCTKRRRPRGCVKVPRSAKRPRRVDQQGSRVLTPRDVVNGGGLGGGPGDDRSTALEWARSQRNLGIWAWRCERFVEEAYGTRDRFPTAIAAARALPLKGGSIRAAPAGSLVYFAADRANRGFGHVGLSLGDGRMISALKKVEITDVSRSRYWRKLYLGWADAPDSWPGRIPPPPGPTTTDTQLTIRVDSPAFGQTISGVVSLVAAAPGAGGVVFDAYYATDPRNPGTRGWHTLGMATQRGDAWALDWDTTTVPDQGYAPWGTVNIAATVLDPAGGRTGTRDFRRVTIDNTGSTGPPVQPPPDDRPVTLTVFNKVTNGPNDMREDTPAYLSTATRNFCKRDGCAVANTDRSTGDTYSPAVCQAQGARTTNGNDADSNDDQNPGLFSSTRWYGIRLGDGSLGYISEVWIDPGQRGGLGLPAC